ncbi:MAG: primosomal protein N' [Candidatus Magasanikbacteria bacterium]|jgi:primosomal protein N'|nr:primosomal protein N' [Candidatus Magasanikbacteria bacterium]MBT4071777.1 primosomal protein N' [Candidatus Magasanikbacteria bacterium]
MFVDIIPIKRFPKHISSLTYTVPEELESRIAPGQLVSIPLRSSQIFGIVLSSYTPKVLPQHNTKMIIDIIHDTPLVSSTDMQAWQTWSTWYGVSIGVIAKMALLPMQKRKLGKMELEICNKKIKTKHHEKQTIYGDKKQRGIAVKQAIGEKGQTLILVPDVSSLDIVYNLLDKKQQEKTITYYSGLSTKEQFSRWIQIRNGEVDIIIGTRGAIFLPFYNMTSIIIDKVHSGDHKHWDQNPRFDARDIATYIAREKKCTLTLMTYSPSIDMVAHHTDTTLPIVPDLPTIIDMRGAHATGNYGPFAPSVEERLIDEKKNIFLFLNRRGYASSLRCQDCGFVHTCAECSLPMVYHQTTNALHCHYCHTKAPIKNTCPSCHSNMVKLRGGIGTQLVEEAVKKLLPHTPVYRIDGEETPEIDYDTPHVIVGTKRAMSYVDWEKTGTIVCLDIDRQLALPEYRAQESIWHFIHDIIFLKEKTANYIIQTRHPDHILFTSLGNPKDFYDIELKTRKQFGYPPYGYVVRYMYRHINEDVAKKEAKRIYDTLSDIIEKQKKPIKLQGPFSLHPVYYRKQYWYAIIAHMPQEHWEQLSAWFHPYVPSDWLIDPSPSNILRA